MARFLLRRIAFGAVVLWLVVTLVFLLYFVAPHDPSQLIAGRQATPQTVAAVRHSLYLDRPLWSQYWHFVDLLTHGELISYRSHERVTSVIAAALPVDLSLAVGAAILWMAIGLSVGILAALRPRGLTDRTATVFVLFFLSTPWFVVGLALLYLFFYLPRIHGVALFPAPGYVPISAGVLPWAHAMVLPWIALALVTAATYSRLTRGALLDVLGEDYIRTARAQGLTERRIVSRHAMRSAVAPLMTQFGIDLATVMSGLIVIELVFGLNGLGRLALNSVTAHDLPVIMGVAVLGAAFTVVANIVVDVLYAIVDPRVRLG